MPFLIVGTIIPAIIYDKYERLGSILFAATWIITYAPYSFRIIVYAINGQIFGTSHTFTLSYSLAGYYPTMVLMGIAKWFDFLLFIHKIQPSKNTSDYDTSDHSKEQAKMIIKTHVINKSNGSTIVVIKNTRNHVCGVPFTLA